MRTFLKACCLALYAAALAATLFPVPTGIATALRIIALVLLAAHAVELVVAWRFVKRHPGPLIESIALTLLFGFLHWWPLKNADAGEGK